MSYIKIIALSVLAAVAVVIPIAALLHRPPTIQRNKSIGVHAQANSETRRLRGPKSREEEATEEAYNREAQRAREDLDRGQPIAAEASYRRLLEMDPGRKSALLGIARSIRARGRPGEAMSAYQVALHREGSDAWSQFIDPDSLTEYGDLARQLGDTKTAVLAYEKISEIGPVSYREEIELGYPNPPADANHLAAWAHVQLAEYHMNPDPHPDIEIAYKLEPRDSIVELSYSNILEVDGDKTAARIMMLHAEQDAPTQGLKAHIHYKREMNNYLYKSHRDTLDPKTGTYKVENFPYPDNEPLVILPHKQRPLVPSVSSKPTP